MLRRRRTTALVLDRLLHKQEAAQRVYYKCAPARLPMDRRADYVRTMTLAATDELHELLNETDWKPWKKEPHSFSRRAYIAELADVMLFVLNLALVEDIDGAELSEALDTAWLKNAKRRTTGY